jgi:dTDP-4-amino-4,6-dideoxygalactose transaminase
MHLQPLAKKYSFDDFQISQFPIANNLWENGLYLPSGLGNTDDEILSVVEALWSLPGLTKTNQRKDA